jgi:hypothetical protein
MYNCTYILVYKEQCVSPRRHWDSPTLSTLLATLWYFKTFKETRYRFQGIDSASLCSLAGRYDIPIPSRLLTPKDCFKIPALFSWHWLPAPDDQKNWLYVPFFHRGKTVFPNVKGGSTRIFIIWRRYAEFGQE